MTKEPQNSQPTRRVDRLSRLPNELLDTIFDLAYPYCYPYRPPKFPISKGLRPFQERLLYREINLSSVDQFHALSRTLDLDPTRGELVEGISIVSCSRPREDPSKVSLDDLLSRLPNLVALELPTGSHQYQEPSESVLTKLSKVKYVTTTVHVEPPDEKWRFHPSPFAFLSALPNLVELAISAWPYHDDFVWTHTHGHAFEMRSMWGLRIEGPGAGAPNVAAFIALCPNLVHLELITVDGGFSSSPDSSLLRLLPVTLQSLRLDCPMNVFAPCEQLLTHLTQLRRLDLGSACHSYDVHTALAQLPLLVSVRLGNCVVDFAGFASLVSGPSRLVHLEHITLDTFLRLDTLMGTRTPAPSDPSFSAAAAESLDRYLNDWAEPDNYLGDPNELRALVRACEANGVALDGTMRDLCEPLEAWNVECNNRAVLICASGHDRQFTWLGWARARAARAGVSLPTLDLDELDPARLEVVEIELPEKDWFVLSLRNKSEAQE
ncbi:hypothetical protein JCM11491_001271 [Sporobolomyces phaffii]